jgi:Zn-dependent protease
MDELQDILIAMVTLVIACTIAFWGAFQSIGLIPTFIVLFFTIGIGFIGHEMGHKWAAERFGTASRFVMWPQGLLMMLLFAVLLGFIFAAPGAVYIFARQLSKRENGLISLAGPAINILFCLIFAAVLMLPAAGIQLAQLVLLIARFGMQINAFLAFFNLIPIFILDGAKIMNWNFWVWLGAIATSFGMLAWAGFL